MQYQIDPVDRGRPGVSYPFIPRAKARTQQSPTGHLSLLDPYLWQDEYWQTKDRGIILVSSMTAMHRRNAWMWMHRNARQLMVLHMQETSAWKRSVSSRYISARLTEDPCWASNALVATALYKRIKAFVKLDLEQDWCKRTSSQA